MRFHVNLTPRSSALSINLQIFKIPCLSIPLQIPRVLRMCVRMSTNLSIHLHNVVAVHYPPKETRIPNSMSSKIFWLVHSWCHSDSHAREGTHLAASVRVRPAHLHRPCRTCNSSANSAQAGIPFGLPGVSRGTLDHFKATAPDVFHAAPSELGSMSDCISKSIPSHSGKCGWLPLQQRCFLKKQRFPN